MNEREKIQNEAIESWIASNKNGCVILPTGTGKTRVGVLATRHAKTALIVTSRKNLVKQWQSEIDRWGSGCKVEILVINTAYKQTKDVDLLLVDEAHRSLSDQFFELYRNVSYKHLLLLTATPPERPERMAKLEQITSIVYQKQISEILGKDIISDIKVYNLSVSLDKETVGKYSVFNRMMNEAAIQLSAAKVKYGGRYKSVFELASDLAKSKAENPDVSLAKQYWFAMSKRKEVIYNSKSKIPVTLEIIKKFPERKFIIFTKSIKFCNDIAEMIPGAVSYHSKLKLKEREEILEKYSKGQFRVLVSVDALNEGLDVPAVDMAICVSGVSTALVNTQQTGRIVRFQEGKKAIFVNLVLKDTQEEKWVSTKTQNYPFVSNITKISEID